MSDPQRKTDEEIRERIKLREDELASQQMSMIPSREAIMFLEGELAGLYWVLGE